MSDSKQGRSATAGSRKAEAAKQLRDNIRLLTNEFRDWVGAKMWPQGMTVAQLRMLYAVHMDPEASSAAIARQCQVTPQTLQAMLQRAVREKWLLRRPAAHNARILLSTLTPKGEALLTEAKNAVAAFEVQVWRDVSTSELQAINAVFRTALDRIQQTAAAPATQERNARKPATPKRAARR